MDRMSEQDKLLCQCMRPSYLEGLCGRPAVWRYRSLSELPYLLCERCVVRFKARPWMAKRLTRLDATEAGTV